MNCDSNDLPELMEGETLDFQMDGVQFARSREQTDMHGARGKLYITSRRVIFVSEVLSIDYDVQFITLHAISRDPTSYSVPCIYCQLDEDEHDLDEHDRGDDLDSSSSEIYLVPPDERDLSSIFEALSHAALQNPDILEDGTEDGQQAFIYNVDDLQHSMLEGVETTNHSNSATLQHLENVFSIPDVEDSS